MELIHASEVARRCKVTRQCVSKWIRVYVDFPRPRKIAGDARLYDWAEVECWQENRVRSLGGRPAKQKV